MSKEKSLAHPLYALAMRQLEAYRSVAKEEDRDRRKIKRSSTGEDAANDDESESGSAGVGSSKRKKKRARTTKSAAVSAPLDDDDAINEGVGQAGDDKAAVANASPVNSNDQVVSVLQQCQISFERLEELTLQKLPPKLPSPLQELHRLYLQARRNGDTDERFLINKHYKEEVGQYLSQVTQQANNSAHPALLPSILEGLDVLRHNPPPDLSPSIRFTYKHVLNTYLRLIHPAFGEAVGAAARGKSKRNNSRASAGGGGDVDDSTGKHDGKNKALSEAAVV